MSPSARLSVGMPVYNGANYLQEALDSILSQTFEDFELVISDNGSTDATPDICRRYVSADTRIRYVRHPKNLGAAFNFNYVFQVSTAPYFRWAAHDDICAPTLFERLTEAMDQAPPEVAAVQSKMYLMGLDNSEPQLFEDGLDVRDPRPDQRIARVISRFKKQDVLFGLLRSDVLRKTRLMDDFMGSDEVLVAELALLGQFWQLPEPLFYRRWHPGTSVRANPDPRSRTRWLDPLAKGERFFPRWRMFREDLRSVGKLPLTVSDRWRSRYALSQSFLRRHWRQMAREVVDNIAGAS